MLPGDSKTAQLLGEIRAHIADDDLDHALRKLMDLSRDLAPRRMRDVVLICNSLTKQNKQLLALGHSPQLRADGAELVQRLLELAEDIASDILRGETAPPGRTQGDPAIKSEPSGIQSGPVALHCDGITKHRQLSVPAFTLIDISLELKLSEVLAVVGPNGHGKSTLLDILAGRLRHDSGRLEYPALCSGSLYWPEVKRNLAYVPQQSELHTRGSNASERANDNRDIERFLRFTAALYGARDQATNDTEVEYVLRRLGLNEYRDTTFDKLSGGYRARFALGVSLLKKPKLLILDEPLAHLDKNAQLRFLRDLRELSRSESYPFACVISSQHLHEVEAISDATLFLENGRSKYYGPTRDIGADGETQTYELQCGASKEDLLPLLGDLNAKVERSGPYLLITVPRTIELGHVVSRISGRCEVTYARNISRSSRLFFNPE